MNAEWMRRHSGPMFEDALYPQGFTLSYWISAVLILLICCFRADDSAIEGTVKDNQGLAVAGAKDQVTSAALAIDRSITTEADGTYLATIPAGLL